MRPANIELHVEELVLHGFDPRDRHRIGQTAEQELGRLFAERGAPLARSGELADLDGGSFEVRPGSGAEAIGVQVARAVYGGLGA